ncbi:MAG: nitroreductase family protein [Methanomicrobiales archaeon]|jgi:nitroreductase|nr:nitroreductase family protein [Methanomicrobiales archaeon]
MNLGITIIKGRRSIRKYKDEPIPQEAIEQAMECARMAPTARNGQPWLFGVTTDSKILEKLGELASHGKFIADAPACFAIFGLRDEKFYLEDCCAATSSLILGLWAYGISSCWVAGDKMDYNEDVRKLMKVPPEYTLVSLIPAGYPALGERMVAPVKKPFEKVTFKDTYTQ